MHNFFDCIKDGGKTISDAWTHHRSLSACHLANIAMSLDRKRTFDPKKEVFVGDDQASEMLQREQRPEDSIYGQLSTRRAAVGVTCFRFRGCIAE